MVNQSGYYHKLHDYISQDKVRIYLVLSPPRTGSTLMEAVLSQNRNIDFAIHEPFVQLGYYGENAEDGYKTIVEKVDSFDKNGRINVLVKEMSHWLDAGEEYKRFLLLVSDSVLFLIRNPMLSMESRIKKVLQVWEMRDKPQLIDWLARETQTEIGEYSLATQKRLLDTYAQKFGHESWAELRGIKFQEQDYRYFGDLLGIEGLFPAESSGWTGLDREITYLDEANRDFMIVDSTEFRLRPGQIIQGIFEAWNMDAPKNVEIKGRGYETDGLDIRMQKAHYRLWYDSLMDSSEIRLPTERVPKISGFPDEIRAHLEELAIPIYLKSFTNSRRVKRDFPGTNGFDLETVDPYLFALMHGKETRNGIFASPNGYDHETWDVWRKSIVKKNLNNEGDFRGRRK